MKDEEIVGWFTTENGVHIPLKKGQTKEEALAQKFDDGPENDEENEKYFFRKSISFQDNYDKTAYADFCQKRINNVELKYYYQDKDGKYLKGSQLFRRRFWNQFDSRTVNNPRLENLLMKKLPKLHELRIKDFGGTWYKSAYGRISITVSLNNPYLTIQHFTHEASHFLDYEEGKGFRSSTFISPTYNKSLSDMIKEEFSEISDSDIIEFRDMINEVKNQLMESYKNKSISQSEYLPSYSKNIQALIDMADTVQSCKGFDKARELCGFGGHKPTYFLGMHEKENRGTELFAEITNSLITDERRNFVDFLRKKCPKSMNIYWEIIKEMEK